MRKVIISNFQDFFQRGPERPFSMLAELEHRALTSQGILSNISIGNCIFVFKGVKHHLNDQIIIYTFV
jgi:hypothetical protein